MKYDALVFGTLLVLIVVLMVFVSSLPDEDETHAPYGCTYIDMNPSKGSDYRLACVPGYPRGE